MLDSLFAVVSAFLAAKLIPAIILTVFVTSIAYVRSNRAKLLIFSMPVPFSCSYLQSGLAISNTHLTGMVLVTLYHWLVFLVVRRFRGPLAIGIALGAAGYLASAWFVAHSPRLEGVRAMPFLALAGVLLALWILGVALYKPQTEPGHRSFAPWYIKSPVIFLISLLIFAATPLLAGGVTTFPYAGVFTSYEMRRSLRTLAGQYTINNLSFLLMFVAIWALEQNHAPRLAALAGGWIVLSLTLAAVYRVGMGPAAHPADSPTPAAPGPAPAQDKAAAGS